MVYAYREGAQSHGLLQGARVASLLKLAFSRPTYSDSFFKRNHSTI